MYKRQSLPSVALWPSSRCSAGPGWPSAAAACREGYPPSVSYTHLSASSFCAGAPAAVSAAAAVLFNSFRPAQCLGSQPFLCLNPSQSPVQKYFSYGSFSTKSGSPWGLSLIHISKIGVILPLLSVHYYTFLFCQRQGGILLLRHKLPETYHAKRDDLFCPSSIRKKPRPVRSFLHFSRGQCTPKACTQTLAKSRKSGFRHFFETLRQGGILLPCQDASAGAHAPDSSALFPDCLLYTSSPRR